VGLLLHVKTLDGHWHQWAMPLRLLSDAGAELGGALRDLGATFAIGSRAKNALLNLLNSAMPEKRAWCVPHVGWHGRAFVLPEQAFGDTEGQLVVFQPTTPLKHAYRVSGTLKAWQAMARLAVGNSRLVFLLSTAFAGPLLQLVGVEGGGVHLVGSSTVGKTTGLKVAGSVWGGGGLNGYIRTWRATDNALEGTAVAHCDTLLCLDEMAEVDSRTAFRTAYMLPNGQGKARAGRMQALALDSSRTCTATTGRRISPMRSTTQQRRTMAMRLGCISIASRKTLRSRGRRFDSPWSHGHGSIAERVTVKCAGLPGGLP
jgi:putative DNA primase/helicase